MGTLYENIMALCNERGIKGATLANATGISKGLLTDLKMGRRTGVSAATAQKIASYFGVSVGYLLGEETENAPTADSKGDILDEVDIAFYGDYKELNEDDKATLRDMVRIMRERRSKKREQ